VVSASITKEVVLLKLEFVFQSEIDELNKLKKLGLEYFQKGKKECINPKLNISEQADLLPYDSQKWEFPRDKLKLGKLDISLTYVRFTTTIVFMVLDATYIEQFYFSIVWF
jgi:hypothetical protein